MPRQATCLRNVNRIPFELVTVYRCHILRTLGPTLDGEYFSQKTATKLGQVQLQRPAGRQKSNPRSSARAEWVKAPLEM